MLSIFEWVTQTQFQDSYEFKEHFLTSEVNYVATKQQDSFLSQGYEPIFMNKRPWPCPCWMIL